MSELKVRPFVAETDYGVFVDFWEKRKFTPPKPDEALSQTGFVCEKEGKVQALTFVYITNSPVALLAWTTVDPKLEREERDAALDYLISWTDHFLSKLDRVKMAWFFTAHGPLIERYVRHGYTKFDDAGNTIIAKAFPGGSEQ